MVLASVSGWDPRRGEDSDFECRGFGSEFCPPFTYRSSSGQKAQNTQQTRKNSVPTETGSESV